MQDQLFDVGLAEVRTAWTPRSATDRPPAYAVGRFIGRQLPEADAHELCRRFNALRLSAGGFDPWAVAIVHTPEFARTTDELLDEARVLLAAGFHYPAAVIVRCALDTCLRRLLRDVKAKGRDGFKQRVETVRKAGICTRDDARRLLQIVAAGHRAAHNSPVSVDEVSAMLRDAHEIIVGGD